MNYIGNYSNWINPAWIAELTNSRGTARPVEGQKPDSPSMESQYAKARAAGYKDDDTFFWMFDKNNTTFEITPPFTTAACHWWITKMLPGNFMPMHIDPHTEYDLDSSRYWIPLQDWEPGHIFMYENRVITDYKAGDVWEYADPCALHGAANIGYTIRLALQISTYTGDMNG
jgi:hypothetical protein